MQSNSCYLRQSAFIVNDLDQAIRKWETNFGIGPFFCLRHIKFREIRYRGQLAELDISLALAFSGDHNVELIEQHNDGPSAYRDTYAKGEEGFHHIIIFPDNYESEVARYESLGFSAATTGLVNEDGLRFAYMDTRSTLGCMVEIVSHGAPTAFWKPMIDASKQWKLGDPPSIEVSFP
jgi:hypothetical protein